MGKKNNPRGQVEIFRYEPLILFPPHVHVHFSQDLENQTDMDFLKWLQQNHNMTPRYLVNSLLTNFA